MAVAEGVSPLPFASPLVRDPRRVGAYRQRYVATEFVDVAVTGPEQFGAIDALAFVRDSLYARHADRSCLLVALLPLADLLAAGEWVDRLLRYA